MRRSVGSMSVRNDGVVAHTVPTGTVRTPSGSASVGSKAPQGKIAMQSFVGYDIGKADVMSVRHDSHLTSGQKNKSRLSEDKVLQIRHLINEGHKLDIIAEKMGVSRPCISNIKNGKTYKNVK